MDAVLPLTVRDLERATVLLDSLVRRFEGLGPLWIVCPDLQAHSVEAGLREFARALDMRVLVETQLIPELTLTPRLRGWYRQQLVKLAIHERVTSDLYLTLDADVICTKRVRAEQLAPHGRGPCHVIPRDLHPDWYRGAEAVLGLRGPQRGVLHNVTPAVLHRHGVAELARYLEARAGRRELSNGLRGLKQRMALSRAQRRASASFRGWRLLLAAGAPWTEYALYYTFLEASGAFARYHEYQPVCIYDIERSVWRADKGRFDEWDFSPAFAGDEPPWFVVVQSNTAIAPARIREKLDQDSRHV